MKYDCNRVHNLEQARIGLYNLKMTAYPGNSMVGITAIRLITEKIQQKIKWNFNKFQLAIETNNFLEMVAIASVGPDCAITCAAKIIYMTTY
jgi:glutathione peroxidase-family protein